MKLVRRYLLKQHALPFVFALSALTAIMLLNQIAKRLEDLLGKGLPWTVIVEFFALTIPFIIAMTISMAVLVGVLYTMSRLGGDREITALRAGGISLGQLLWPLLLGATLVAVVAFAFGDQVLPRSNHRLRTLMTDIYRTKPTFSLKEHVINEVQKGRLALRAARIDQATYQMLDVTVYDLTSQDQRRVIYADSGRMAFAPNQEDLNLELYDGTIHEFDRTDLRMFQKIGFERDQIVVRGVGSEFIRRDEDSYRGDREMGVCELEGVVQNARRDEWLAARRAEVVRQNGLRDLVNLSPLPADTAVPAADESLYCRALGAAGVIGRKIAQFLQAAPATSAHASSANEFGDEQRTGAQTDSAPPAARDPDPTIVRLSRRSVARRMSAETRSRELRAQRDRVRSARIRASVYSVEAHKKYAIPAACVVFVLVGVPIALRFPSGGVGLVAGASMVIFGLYYVGLIAGESLANRLIVPPFWAMWAPNLLFAATGIIALLGIRREGTVSRRKTRDT
jgi:lipopolysaccharide export system permease protein